MKKVISIIIVVFLLEPILFSQDNNNWLDRWQDRTVSLGVIDTALQNGNIIVYYKVLGTGIIGYLKTENPKYQHCIITAKHVINDEKVASYSSLKVRFSWFDHIPLYQYFGIDLQIRDDSGKVYFEHPDPNVDLVCIPFNLSVDKAGRENFPVFGYNELAKTEDYYEGRPIYVFGYPSAVGAQFHNKAIIRSGIISWTPNAFGEHAQILIDCEVFPGNSGGPVFSQPNYFDSKGGYHVGEDVKILGIVTQRRLSTTETFIENKENPITDNQGNKLLSYESIGIGVVEPAIRIRELLDYVNGSIK